MIEQRLVHGRHTRHRGGLGSFDRFKRLPRIEPRQHCDAAAIRHGAIEHGGIGKNMEQGQHPHDHIAIPAVRINRNNLTGIGGQILVGQHRPFGGAGGPAGILQQCQIVFGVERNFLRHGRVQHVAPAQHIRCRGNRRKCLSPDQPQRRRLKPGEHFGERSNHQHFQS